MISRFLVLLLSIACIAACAGQGGTPVAAQDPPAPATMPPIPKHADLRQMLAQSRFAELDDLLEQYRVASLWDIEHGEPLLIASYHAFSVADNKVLKQIDAWVEERPKSYQARTARAFCNVKLGGDARGGAWAKDTKAEQFDLMYRFFGSAEKDARAALKLQPRNVAAYRALVVMAMHGKMDFGAIVKEALAAFPASFTLRINTVMALQPRWNAETGDYSLIERFVTASQEHAGANPRLKELLGYPLWARGRDLVSDKRFAEAVEMYTRALEIAEADDFLRDRSYAARQVHDYKMAFKDAKRFTELTPWNEDSDDNLVPQVTRAAIRHAYELSGEDRWSELVPLLDLILSESPEKKELVALRGNAHCRMGHLPAALGDFARALTLDPDYREARTAEWICLASNGKAVDAIKRLQEYVVMAPGNGKAQYELARVLGSEGDIPSAVVAFRYACELSYGDSCAELDRLREKAEALGDKVKWPLELRESRGLHPQERLESIAAYKVFMEELDGSDRFNGRAKGDPPPKFIRRVVPRFPLWTFKEVSKGTVQLLIYINADGTVAGAKPVKSDPPGYFELAALSAVLQWRFEPKPMGMKAVQTLSFTMAEGDKPSKPRK